MRSALNARDKIKVSDIVVSTSHMTFLTHRFSSLISLPTTTIFVSGTSGITAILKYRSVNPMSSNSLTSRPQYSTLDIISWGFSASKSVIPATIIILHIHFYSTCVIIILTRYVLYFFLLDMCYYFYKIHVIIFTRYVLLLFLQDICYYFY